MTNPFDAEDGRFVVLVNAIGEYSIWPVGIDVPSGWTACHGPSMRRACLDYVTAHWTDLAPRPRTSG